MRTKNATVRTSFGPDTRFELSPAPPSPFRGEQESRFEELKNRLLAEQLRDPAKAVRNSSLRRAANEAEALAWVTPYPLLVFPVLFEEKARGSPFGGCPEPPTGIPLALAVA